MTRHELTKLESSLQQHGYRMRTKGLTSNEKYGWFKPFKDRCGNLQYIVEFRVWRCDKLLFAPSTISVDAFVIHTYGNAMIDTQITTPLFDIKTTETIAAELRVLYKRHIDKYNNQTTIINEKEQRLLQATEG